MIDDQHCVEVSTSIGPVRARVSRTAKLTDEDVLAIANIAEAAARHFETEPKS